MFSVTFPRYRERPLEYNHRTHHYIVAGCKGMAGMATLQLLFDTLCPNTIQNYELWAKKVDENYIDEQERLLRDYGE